MSAVVVPVVAVLCLTTLALVSWGGWQLYAAARAWLAWRRSR